MRHLWSEPETPPEPQVATVSDVPENCECCGQRLPQQQPHRMDKSKANLLIQIAIRNNAGVAWVKIQRGGSVLKGDILRKITVDDTLALRLKWFGLVRTKALRSGLYQITDMGHEFLAGRAAVSSRIWCRGGEVVRSDATLVYLKDVDGVEFNKDFWNNYPKSDRS